MYFCTYINLYIIYFNRKIGEDQIANPPSEQIRSENYKSYYNTALTDYYVESRLIFFSFEHFASFPTFRKHRFSLRNYR